ncbi:hypothetical protein BIU88_02775 [Chlorobaculum limnaeum]|uniref:VWFA domain-containing protein n=1 Tax=Chlorobaculum limnaeum TaxID=274537 RepID=A0A1D8CYE3_CHLLM|nr:VWA domain-containing protein [Chlorobaculum limnaeum]AOS83161.1 hypothetical protein BIU88_02775 [Chlorobaculum limnaeum]
MDNNVNLQIIPERTIIRNDNISEIDIVIEITSTSEYKKVESSKNNLNLAIVIDRSGSMSGEKLEIAKNSCIEIFKRLKQDDFLTVIVYDNEAEVIVNPQTKRGEIIEKIKNIEPRGMTNLSLGWYLGLLELQTYLDNDKINKLILLSDGLANTGETKKSILGNQASKSREEYSIITSTIGIGDDFDEELLEIISNESGGRFWYIQHSNINEIIEEEFIGTLNIILDNPKIELNLGKGVKISKELNMLRKASNKYSIRPITDNDENRFAIRLELNPQEIGEEAQITAKLLNRNQTILDANLSLNLDSFESYAQAPINQEVLAIVQKFEKSKTEEELISKIEEGDFDFMKNMIIKEVAGMKKVVAAFEDEKKREYYRKDQQDLENMSYAADVLIKINNLSNPKYRNEFQALINHCNKSLTYQMHRHNNGYMRHHNCDFMQIDLLERLSVILENLALRRI